jgi:DNA-directed RNA polymerase specialized sigma24 family protein
VDSFDKVLDGSRKWNRETYPTLECFLRSIVDSDINHLADSLDNSHSRRIAPTKAPNGVDEAERVEGREVNPVFAVVNKEAHEQFLATAMKELEGDDFLVQLLDCLEAEITEPVDIAEMLGISVDDVNNGKKRLRRKLDTLYSPRRKDRP